VIRSPSIVPGFDVDVYLVLDDFGSIGRAYREVDEESADKASLTRHNDPHGEHDCFFFQVEGERYFCKVDYYDRSMEYGSENPEDPEVTTKVLTIGTAADY
jgi:hypothetical protein